ncbi:DUF3618 domain-containing protein [Streptomyces sp. enrichment culture]|uniref:DUF3618 domain-containing protein n=1 Tax=Streptomyces sp. enrichment culture TaxID=1795815 RepID=UPI003F57050D
MGTAPDRIRADIESTRERLSEDVSRLADRARPRQVVRRRTRRARGALHGVRERVMGSTAEITGQTADRGRQAARSVQDTTGQAAGKVGDTARQAAGQAGETVRQAPEQVMRQTEGNPLAAGLIAFGAGLLTASLLPTSRAEEQAAGRAGQAVEPVKQAALESAQQLKDDAAQAGSQAVQEVKDTAAEAARTTKDAAAEQAGQVTDRARRSAQTTAEEARGQTGGT